MAKATRLDRRTIIYLSFEILVGIIAILGNALVAVIFVRDRRMRTPTNFYIFSLAIVNLLTCIVAIPAYLHSMVTLRPHEFNSCLYVNTLLITFCTISIFHLVAVSFDRYLAVVWHHKPTSHWRGMVHALILILVAWVAGTAIGVMPLMGWNGGKPDQGQVEYCEFLRVMDTSYLMFIFYATVVTPSVLLIFFYVSIFFSARRHRGRLASIGLALDTRMSIVGQNIAKPTEAELAQEEYGEDEEEKENADHQEVEETIRAEATQRDVKKLERVTFSLFLVIVFFHICWYPLHIMNLITYYAGESIFERWHFFGPIVLSHASNAINPFIYGFTMPKYKEAFVEALACKEQAEEQKSTAGFRRKYQLTERIWMQRAERA